jgi:hypothetical protein
MLCFVLLGVLGCGTGPGAGASEASFKPKLVGSFSLADQGLWQAQLNWSEIPRYSDREFLEMTGTVLIHMADDALAEEIKNVTFTADMPQHGHGTGNILPTIQMENAATGTLRFANLLFTMTGSWRIRVTATVNGNTDAWTEIVEVQ